MTNERKKIKLAASQTEESTKTDDNGKKESSLEKAIRLIDEGNFDSFKDAIQAHPEIVNQKDEGGSSLLHYAVARGNKEITEFLIEKGANIESEDCFESTPLHIASCNLSLELVELLIEKGANVKVVDKFSKTVLHSAACGIIDEEGKEDWEVVEYLLEKGVPTNITTKGGLSVKDIFRSKDWSYADTYERIKSGEMKAKRNEKRKLEEELREIIDHLLPEENSNDYDLIKNLLRAIVTDQKRLTEKWDESAKISLEATKKFAIDKGLEGEKIEELCKRVDKLAEIIIKENQIEFIEEKGKPWVI